MRPQGSIERLASSSHGVVTRAQLLAAGCEPAPRVLEPEGAVGGVGIEPLEAALEIPR